MFELNYHLIASSQIDVSRAARRNGKYLTALIECCDLLSATVPYFEHATSFEYLFALSLRGCKQL
jgi:hypothetical protein